MPPDASGKPVAFVTGAAGGIGKAVVSRLRQRGLRVYATEEFRNSYMTNRPEIARAVVLAVFICFVGVFCVMIVLWKTNQIGW